MQIPEQSVSRRKFLKAAGAAGVLGAVGGAGYLLGTANAIPSANNSVVEPGSMKTEADFIIYYDGTNYLARNGKTGANDYSGTDAISIINNAITALPSFTVTRGANNYTARQGKLAFAGGDFNGLGPINIPFGSILQFDGVVPPMTYLNIETVASTRGTVLRSTNAATPVLKNTLPGGAVSGNSNFIGTNLIIKNMGLQTADSNTPNGAVDLRGTDICYFENVEMAVNGLNTNNPAVPTAGGIGFNDNFNLNNYMTFINTSVLGYEIGWQLSVDLLNMINCLAGYYNLYGVSMNVGIANVMSTFHALNGGQDAIAVFGETQSGLASLTINGFFTERSAGQSSFLNERYAINMAGHAKVFLTNWQQVFVHSAFTIGGGVATDLAILQGMKPIFFNGTTAGTVEAHMHWQGPSYKKVIVFLSGYKNGTGTAQTVTYTTAFINSPKIVSDDSGGSTTNTTTLTLPINMANPVTGWVIIEGY